MNGKTRGRNLFQTLSSFLPLSFSPSGVFFFLLSPSPIFSFFFFHLLSSSGFNLLPLSPLSLSDRSPVSSFSSPVSWV